MPSSRPRRGWGSPTGRAIARSWPGRGPSWSGSGGSATSAGSCAPTPGPRSPAPPPSGSPPSSGSPRWPWPSPAPTSRTPGAASSPTLTERKDQLEEELTRQSAAFRAARAEARRTPEQLQAALPRDAALIDVLEYTHFSPPPERKGKLKFERRLIAFVVRPDRPIARVELGPLAPIRAAIDAWRPILRREQPAPRDEHRRPGGAAAAAGLEPLGSRTWRAWRRCWSRPTGRWAWCRWRPCRARRRAPT